MGLGSGGKKSRRIYTGNHLLPDPFLTQNQGLASRPVCYCLLPKYGLPTQGSSWIMTSTWLPPGARYNSGNRNSKNLSLMVCAPLGWQKSCSSLTSVGPWPSQPIRPVLRSWLRVLTRRVVLRRNTTLNLSVGRNPVPREYQLPQQHGPCMNEFLESGKGRTF